MVMTFRQKLKPLLSKEIKDGNFVHKEISWLELIEM